MSRIRLAGVLAVALAIGACQGAASSPTLPTSLPSGLPSGLPSLPPELASLLPSSLPSIPALRQSVAQFSEVDGSGITGGAILTDIDGQTIVTIGVVAPGETAPLMARIVAGSCSDVSDTTPSVAVLPDLAAGAANGTITMTLDDLTSSAHALVILRGDPPPSVDPSVAPPAETPAPSFSETAPIGEIGETVACADIPAPVGG